MGDDLGPVDRRDRVIGGRYLGVVSTEIERSIARRWAVASFVDAGNAADSFNSLKPVYGVGVGVRWATLLPDVTIGFDTDVYAIISPFALQEFNIASLRVPGVPLILGLSFAPVIQYVF